jgi:hypothetical protein
MQGTLNAADQQDDDGWKNILSALGSHLNGRFAFPLATLLGNLDEAQGKGETWKKFALAAVDSKGNPDFMSVEIAKYEVNVPELEEAGFTGLEMTLSCTLLSVERGEDFDVQMFKLSAEIEAPMFELDIALDDPCHWQVQGTVNLSVGFDFTPIDGKALAKEAGEKVAEDVAEDVAVEVCEGFLAAAAPFIGGIVGGVSLAILCEYILYGMTSDFKSMDERCNAACDAFEQGFRAGITSGAQPDGGDEKYNQENAKNGFNSGTNTRKNTVDKMRAKPGPKLQQYMDDNSVDFDTAFAKVGLTDDVVNKLTSSARAVHFPAVRYKLACDFVDKHCKGLFADGIAKACGAAVIENWYIGDGFDYPTGDQFNRVVTQKGFDRIPEPLKSFYKGLDHPQERPRIEGESES